MFLHPRELSAQTDPANPDVRLFRSINNAQSKGATSLLTVTDASVYPVVAGVPAVLTVYGYAAGSDDAFETGILSGGAEIAAYGIRSVFKYTLRRERPYVALRNVHVGRLETADPYSFPSGHTTGAFALATMLTLRYPKPQVYVPLFLWAGVVGYGRMYFGLHYPSDVLGGAVIGAGSALLVNHFREDIFAIVRAVTGGRPPAGSSLMIVPAERGFVLVGSVRW